MEGATSNRVSYQWRVQEGPPLPSFYTKLGPEGPIFFLDRVPPISGSG